MDPERDVPEVRLTPEARVRRREELMRAIDAADRRGRRWLAPLAAAAVVAVVGGAVAVAAGLGGEGARDDARPPVAGSGGVGVSASAPSREPRATPECLDLPGFDDVDPRPWDHPAIAPYLRSYRAVLARHLDPAGEHLERRSTNLQSSHDRCTVDALGTKLAWRVAGSEGTGVVQVEVGKRWAGSQVRMHREAFGGRWRTVPTDLPGVEKARVVEHDGGLAVAVTRADGLTVAIDADRLFGGNAVSGVPGIDLTVDDLLEAAADPELSLP